MKKNLLLILLGMFVSIAALAQSTPERGKYYRIYNAAYGSVITEDWGPGTISGATMRMDDYTQMWMYTSNGSLQNVFTGKYLQAQTAYSSQFRTGMTQQSITFELDDDGHYNISAGGAYLHDSQSQGHQIVRWNPSIEPSHWYVEEITLSAETVKAAREEYKMLSSLKDNAAKYTQTLLTFFTNELCTELNATYASMTDEELKAAMTEAGLPSMLQDIAVKVKNNWWNDTENSTYADKNKYAKEFRVAKYEPYSDARNWQNKLWWNGASYMGNPTGIYTKNKDVLHVFVGSDIPEGATLYLTPVRRQGLIRNRTEGTELKKGYNAVIATNDSLAYFVNYVVNTIDPEYWNGGNWNRTDAAGNTIKKVSDYPELDIHIEGGQCVGYYEKPAVNSPEEDAKYQYLTQNAIPKSYFMVKGESTLFYFQRETYTQFKRDAAIKAWDETIWNSIDWFDRVQYWQFGLIGILDNVANGLCENGTEYSKSEYPFNIKGGDAFYPTYCNNPSLALQVEDGKNPHASQFYTGYPGMGGVESSFNADRPDFDNWCCGHEHGHSIQHPYNLESCTESSVNLGSQLITYMTGYRMGRGWNFADNYAYVAKGTQFGQRDISITMRMYWNLYLYYHMAGKKKDFYPTFVKMLREDPMDFSKDGGSKYNEEYNKSADHHRAVNTWIKMYKHACDAAQEDLTEYFRLWGFFEPCNWMWFGDYGNYWVSLTQEEIDAAIAEVKAKKYPENLQIMFIEDRQILRPRTDIWAHVASGTQKNKPDNDGNWKTQEKLQELYGNVGDVLTYIDGSANTSEYRYLLTANKISMKGKGGVGFIVYDKNGNNRFMSNYYDFEIPTELAQAGFEIRVINADGSHSVAKDGSLDATDEELLAILQDAITASEEYTSLEDKTGKKVGFYNSEDLATLIGLVADANAAIEAENADNYAALANSINNEILRLLEEDPMQKVVANALYNIQSVRKLSNNSQYLTSNSSEGFTASTANNNYSRWALVPTGEEGSECYFLQNRQTSEMIGAVLNEKKNVSGFKVVSADPDEACYFKLDYLDGGKIGLRPLDKTYVNLAPQGHITTWGSADEGSQWYISKYDEFDDITEEDLQAAIESNEKLVNDVCDYSIEQVKYELQCTDAAQANYISTNEADASRPSNQIEKAIDGNNATFFMSNRSSSATASDPHYLMVDLGAGNTSKSLQFMIYGHSSWNYATAINVLASSDGKSWTSVKDFSGMKVAYTSDIITAKTAYRYWRFDVVSTDGKYEDASARPWFTAKEFELYEATANIAMKPGFEGIGNSYINSCKNNISGAESVLGSEFKTALDLYLAWARLTSSYNTLYKKASEIDPTVDITDIEAENGAEGEVYDLSGRKLEKAGENGFYIIGGKKVIK